MEIRARINPISYEKPLLKRRADGNIVMVPKFIKKKTEDQRSVGCTDL